MYDRPIIGALAISNARAGARALAAVILLLFGIGFAACNGSEPYTTGDGESDTGGGDPWSTDADVPTECPSIVAMEYVGSPPVDILVMVDNSRSMTEEQANLAANFPDLIRSMLDPIIDPSTGRPIHVPVNDLHIGVVSSDMGTGGYTVETCADPIDGDDGILLHSPNPSMPGCESIYPTYLSYESDEPDEAAIESMATAFGCIAVLGIDGCGFEQPLEAVKRALVDHTAPGGRNAGFLRPDSVLVVLFVTDEEDCSVAPGQEDIFNTTDTSLGHLNLRCFLHPYKIENIDTYIEAFRGLRSDPDKLLMGFIVGVPQDPTCEGFGDEIPNCLVNPMMWEEPDPTDPTRLRPSCDTSTGLAFPPRRFVQMAQDFGHRSFVRSICTSDFEPTLEVMEGAVHDTIDDVIVPPDLGAEKDPADACRCETSCTMIEELVDLRPCPEGRGCYEPDGPGTGCATSTDGSGLRHSLCVIPEAGTRIKGCDPGIPSTVVDCYDDYSVHMGDGTGWYYVPAGHPGPMLAFTEGMDPTEGSTVYISCCP